MTADVEPGSVLFVAGGQAERRLELEAALPGWELLFVGTGAEALELLDAREVDVLVGDLELADLRGDDLLTQAQIRRPGTARMALTRESDPNQLVQAAQLAQKLLPVSSDVQTLALAVRRVVAVKRTLDDPQLRALIASVDRLPALPDVYQRIVEAAAKPHCTVADIARIVASDMATAADLLRLVNSAMFALPRAVVSIEEAVTLLGLQTVTSLVLAGSIFRTGALPGGLDGEAIRRLAIRSCEVARAVAKSDGWQQHESSQVALAAMLRDAGLLVLAQGNPLAVGRLDLTLADPVARARQEQEAFGGTVAAASAYLLGLWGFPQIVVHAVASQPLIEGEPGSTQFEQILSYAYHRTLGGPGVEPVIPKYDPHRRVRWATAADSILAADEASASPPASIEDGVQPGSSAPVTTASVPAPSSSLSLSSSEFRASGGYTAGRDESDGRPRRPAFAPAAEESPDSTGQGGG